MTAAAPRLTALADAVTADLNAEFTAYTATRQNLPTVTLTDLATPTIVVVPGTKAHERQTRGDALRRYTIEIGIYQRIDPTPADGALDEDETIALAEDILEWWINTKQAPTGYDDPLTETAVYVAAGRLLNDEPFDAQLRRVDGVLRAIIQLDFVAI